MTASPADQLAWQRRAVRVLADLLDLAARDGLPVLAWSVASAGASLAGRSTAQPGTARRDAITAWARALDIELREHRGSGSTVITGSARQRDTRHGSCTIVLTADIYDLAEVAAEAAQELDRRAAESGGSGNE